ncbi:hypothetical protein E2562_008513 [Oryza meyeriana var. granulata]|uniref:Uncharacterized protein n=1 Tax=Oryza meyeriana var. granulata TaxID=110450 RepID=A0A6G1EI00_9ORYZ|nr:hypothetical protein E2562_008513 [Oryza meyeriana var. granulata]
MAGRRRRRGAEQQCWGGAGERGARRRLFASGWRDSRGGDGASAAEDVQRRRRLPRMALGYKGWWWLWLYRSGSPGQRRVAAARGFRGGGSAGLGPRLGRDRQAGGPGSGGVGLAHAGLEAEGLGPGARQAGGVRLYWEEQRERTQR